MKKNKKKQFVEAILLFIVAILTLYFNEHDKKPVADDIKNRQVDIADESNLKVYFIDVGQADAALIFQNNEYMLIDAGNNEDGPKLASYFKSLGITKFKIVIATHAHEDHIGGMDDIINNFTIENFYMPDKITTTKTFEDVLDALEKNKVTFKTPTVNDKLSFQDSSIDILSINSNADNLNDTSIVLKLKYKTTSFLFMGDASSSVEKNILDKDIRSDVLKIGHHGSRYSTSLSFLEKVSPNYAIISSGKNNSYNHPHSETLDRLNKENVTIYRTDELGTIIAESNGTIITFTNTKTDTNG